MLLERDAPNRDASPRTGVPQGKQPHALLAGGLHALSGLFPSHVIRGELQQFGNISLQWHSRVEAVTSVGGAVSGVSFASPDGGAPGHLSADLIVDASGRAVPTMKLLGAIGDSPPEVSKIGINIDYSTAIFAKPKDAADDWLLAGTIPKAPEERHGAIVMPIEGNQWMVTRCLARE